MKRTLFTTLLLMTATLLSGQIPEGSGPARAAVTISPFSILRGDLILGFQQQVGSHAVLHTQLAAIGVGYPELNPNRDRGAFIRAGMRLVPEPAQETPMWGIYFEPRISFSLFRSTDHTRYEDDYGNIHYESHRRTLYGMAGMLGIGTQLRLGKRGVFDMSFSGGREILRSEDSSEWTFFGDTFHGHRSANGWAWSSSLSFGMLLTSR